MTLKIQVKVYAEADTNVERFVPVFHRWIRDRLLDELAIDVVDYTHVEDGPAVVLIGHESDYVLDRGEGRLGLLYVNKRGDVPSPTQALARALRVASLLERENEAPGLRFRGEELLFRVADRLNAPNTDETYERLLPGLRGALEPLYGAGGFELSRVGTTRELFAARARSKTPTTFADLCQRAAISPG
ncbi:MAG TPA: hypothetical protein VIM73_00220 [Polyangiaceae bacterium]